MFVYFIFYDDYDIYDAENDHQNVIHLHRTDSLVSNTSNDEVEDVHVHNRNNNERCALCLDEIICHNQDPPNVFGMTCKICEPPNLKKDFVFRDLTLYNYENTEYTHTCECRPSLHCACFIEIYESQRSCIICKKAIRWRFSKIEDAKVTFYNFIFVTMFNRVYIFANLLFFSYMIIVVIHNTFYSFTNFHNDDT